MNLNWLTDVFPVLNATGLPLLAIAVILLVRAFQKSIETYKETSAHLSTENQTLRERIQETYRNFTEENEKLRERLHKIDTDYFDELDRMKSVVSKTNEAIAELHARKVALLSKPEDSSNEAILSEVQKIGQAISIMQELVNSQKEFKSLLSKGIVYVYDKDLKNVERQFELLTNQVGELAGQIGDTKTRIAVVSILTTENMLHQIKSDTDGQKRGLIAPSREEMPLLPYQEDEHSGPLELAAPSES
jgi:predicted  nucleic acid-binding Zn-ribbon protein